MVWPWALLLFGGDVTVDHNSNELWVANWIQFKASPRIGVLVKYLKQALSVLLSQKFANPFLQLEESSLVHLIEKLILADGLL